MYMRSSTVNLVLEVGEVGIVGKLQDPPFPGNES